MVYKSVFWCDLSQIHRLYHIIKIIDAYIFWDRD